MGIEIHPKDLRLQALRQLSYMLDEDRTPLHLDIRNVDTETWSVKVYANDLEVPVVKSGDDLAALIDDAVETYKRRKVVSEMGEPPHSKRSKPGKKR
jgi:hypothetical protein